MEFAAAFTLMPEVVCGIRKGFYISHYYVLKIATKNLMRKNQRIIILDNYMPVILLRTIK